jgi:sugar O-acyltransferase (sialic acid O-acetyltransferase NeuD family)
MPTDLSIIGAGGHAKVVTEVLLKNSKEKLLIFDSSQSKVGKEVQGQRIMHLEDSTLMAKYHIAIGNNKVRNQLYDKYQNENEYFSVISSSSYIALSASINVGSFIAAKTVISADAQIGTGVIINNGAIVEHDCIVGDFSHVAPNATLLGGVKLGRRVFVGAGATVLPGLRIADDVIIGAGAVVLSDILESCTVAGMPANRI